MALKTVKLQNGMTAPPAAPKAEPKTVREYAQFGACRVLGVLKREESRPGTRLRWNGESESFDAGWYVYVTADGKTKRAMKDAKGRSAGAARPAPHVEPCRNCQDHPETCRTATACIHGREGFCETCAST